MEFDEPEMANYPPSKLVVAMFMCMKKRFLTSLIFVIPSLVLCWAMPEIPAGETGSVTQVGWNPSEIPGIDRLVESVATEVKRIGSLRSTTSATSWLMLRSGAGMRETTASYWPFRFENGWALRPKWRAKEPWRMSCDDSSIRQGGAIRRFK